MTLNCITSIYYTTNAIILKYSIRCKWASRWFCLLKISYWNHKKITVRRGNVGEETFNWLERKWHEISADLAQTRRWNSAISSVINEADIDFKVGVTGSRRLLVIYVVTGFFQWRVDSYYFGAVPSVQRRRCTYNVSHNGLRNRCIQFIVALGHTSIKAGQRRVGWMRNLLDKNVVGCHNSADNYVAAHFLR